jgi:hypothetical protein
MYQSFVEENNGKARAGVLYAFENRLWPNLLSLWGSGNLINYHPSHKAVLNTPVQQDMVSVVAAQERTK